MQSSVGNFSNECAFGFPSDLQHVKCISILGFISGRLQFAGEPRAYSSIKDVPFHFSIGIEKALTEAHVLSNRLKIDKCEKIIFFCCDR